MLVNFSDIAVVPIFDSVLGERVAAVVTLMSPGAGVTVEELRRFAADRLASFKIPEVLYSADSLPRTDTGKIQKFRLRQEVGGGKLTLLDTEVELPKGIDQAPRVDPA